MAQSRIKVTLIRKSKRIQQLRNNVVRPRIVARQRIGSHRQLQNAIYWESGRIKFWWKRYRKLTFVQESIRCFEQAVDCSEKKDDARIAIFHSDAGKYALEIFDTLLLEADDGRTYNRLVNIFEDSCISKEERFIWTFYFLLKKSKGRWNISHFPRGDKEKHLLLWGLLVKF